MSKSVLQIKALGNSKSLKKIFPWADESVIGLMRGTGELKEYRPGEVVYSPDQRVRGLFFIKSGVLKVCQGCGGAQEQIINLFSPGDLVGLRSMLNMEFYDSTLLALASSAIIEVRRDAFLQAVMQAPGISHSVMKQLDNGIAEMEGRLTVLLQRPIKQRLANAIVTLSNKFGCDSNHRLQLVLSPKEWASLICTTRTSLYRMMKAMEDEGLVLYQKHRVTLVNRQELLELAIPQRADSSF